MIDSLTDRSMEMTFTVEEADLKKLQEVLCDIKIEECPWFEVHDKYGKSAKYYREKLPDKQLSNNSPKVDKESGELISRQDAINGKISVQRANGVEIYSDDVVPVKYLKNLPPVQPEHKKGKWIYKDDLKQYFCSECGYPSLTYDDVYIYGMDLPNFCEDCGVDMRTANEEGD